MVPPIAKAMMSVAEVTVIAPPAEAIVSANLKKMDDLTLTGAVYFLAFISVAALPRGTASRQCPEGRRLTQA